MKNVKGSVLIWAVVVILIFSVLAGAGITIGYNMVKRSTDKNIKQQLYLSARSAATVVATELISDNGKNLLDRVVKSKPMVISSEEIFGDNLIGECIVKIKCNENESMIIVTAKAQREKIDYIVSAVIKKDETGKWKIYGYDALDVDESRL